MQENEFKVSFKNKKNAVFFGIFFILFDVMCFWLRSDFVNIIACYAVIAAATVLFLAIISKSLFFYVAVKDDKITVRKNFLSKKIFNVSDIEKVVCNFAYTKNKKYHFIKIIFKNKKVELTDFMNNFPKMAQFILSKYENGEIKADAVSKSCKTKLKNLSNCKIER